MGVFITRVRSASTLTAPGPLRCTWFCAPPPHTFWTYVSNSFHCRSPSVSRDTVLTYVYRYAEPKGIESTAPDAPWTCSTCGRGIEGSGVQTGVVLSGHCPIILNVPWGGHICCPRGWSPAPGWSYPQHRSSASRSTCRAASLVNA
jgi:hypothetical protein